jgi:hypothetical protein
MTEKQSASAELSEKIHRLLPGENNKRIREAILATAGYAGIRTQGLRQEIDEENRLQDGKLQDGTLTFIDATNVELDLFAWVINYQIFQPGFTELVVPTFDPDFAVIGVFTGTALGTIKYYQGAIDGDGNAEFPQIDDGEIILREVLRNTDGTITTTPGGGGGGNFVSKSAPGTQIIKSDFGSEKLKATFRDAIYTDANGVFRKTRVDYHGVYSTVEGTGATDWSKLVTINVSSGQLRYFAMLEFAGVSPTYEKGTVWIQFTTDGAGDLTVNALKVFGEINPAKLKLVKLDAETYAVFVHHNEAAAFFKFRPQFSFGPSSAYTYHHQDGKAPLPAGTQYDFTAYGDLTDIIADIAELFTDLIALETVVDDHEERIEDLETQPYIEDIIAGTNITIDKTDPKNPIINASGGDGGGATPYLTDLDTWPILKFNKNYRYTHEMSGPVEISAEFFTPLAAVGNFCKLYIKADGTNKPDITGDFTVIWDNWVNTAGHWNRFYAEYSPEGKVILQIEQAHLGSANDGSGLTQLTITFEANHVQSHVITNSTEIVIDPLGAEEGYQTILYVKADGINKPFWDSADVTVTYDDYLNEADVWNRIVLECRPESKAIMQLINT